MEIYRRTLNCGAKFVGYNFAGTKPNVSIGILVPRGAAHDPEGLKGAHHFLEHLLFKSKENSRRNELVRELEDIGGDWNAGTEYLNTTVSCTLARDNINVGISFLTELANRPPEFSPHGLGIERKVVYKEMEMAHDNPADEVISLAQTELYLPPFGGYVRGTENSVERITTADMLDLWKEGYAPSNFTIAAVGAVDFDKLSGQFERELEKSSLAGSAQSNRGDILIQPTKGRQVIINPGLEQCHFGFAVHTPLPSDRLFNAFLILDNHLTAGMFSKLPYDIREKRGEAYSVEGEFDCGRDYGFYVVHAGIDPQKVTEIHDLIRRGFESATRMEESELKRIVEKACRSEDNDELSKAAILPNILQREHDGRGAESFLKINEDYRRVTLEEVRYVADIREPTIVAISPVDLPN